MHKEIKEIEEFVNQQDYGNEITENFFLKRWMIKYLLSHIKELERQMNVKYIQGRASQLIEDAETVQEFRVKAEKAEAKVKELEENRNFWAEACKEAQELRGINGADLKQAEAHIRELEDKVRILEADNFKHSDTVYEKYQNALFHIKGLEEGMRNAYEVIDYSGGGDSWEREATEKERDRFYEIYAKLIEG